MQKNVHVLEQVESIYKINKEKTLKNNFSRFVDNNFYNKLINKNYIVVQLSSGDEIHNHKNWEFGKWDKILSLLAKKYPKIHYVLIGGPNERSLLKHININNQIIDMIGKTSIEEMISLIKNAKLYFGLNSGPMHLAFYFKIPTLSIFGDSCSIAYGYENIAKNENLVITSNILSKNKFFCPICDSCTQYSLRDLKVEKVYQSAIPFFEKFLD